MGAIGAKIRTFLSRYYRNRDLGDEDDIFALGFVSSVVAMQLVLFLEKEFSVTIGDDDLDLDNFRTIASMSSLIVTKQAASA